MPHPSLRSLLRAIHASILLMTVATALSAAQTAQYNAYPNGYAPQDQNNTARVPHILKSYLEYLPSGYAATAAPYKLLISLHPWGGGNGWYSATGPTYSNDVTTVAKWGVPALIAGNVDNGNVYGGGMNASLFDANRCIVISPQLDCDDIYVNQSITKIGWPYQEVLTLISWAKSRYNVDPACIYLTGGSRGGGGTLNTMMNGGDALIAACVPIVAADQYNFAPHLFSAPTWAFDCFTATYCTSIDTAYCFNAGGGNCLAGYPFNNGTVSGTSMFVQSPKADGDYTGYQNGSSWTWGRGVAAPAAGRSPIFTIFQDGTGHDAHADIWFKAYNTPALWAWLFSQRKAGATPPPTVAPLTAIITSPADGSVFPSANAITVTATASSGYAITHVEFYSDSSKLFDDTSAPWAWTCWANLAQGSYTFTVKAYDAGGRVVTSAPMHLSVSAPAASGSAPFTGTAVAIPGTIQAENFDNGGEGIAYHDTTSANEGGAFRATGVDLYPCVGGNTLGWTKTGEWLVYSVNIAAAGSYTLSAKVASLGAGGTFHVECDGANVSGAMAIPDTGGWDTWQTVAKTGVSLPAGQHRLRLVIDGVGASAYAGNIDSISLIVTATPGTGLYAEYFSDQNLASRAFTRFDPTVNFNWGGGSPGGGLASDHFSARWTGFIKPGSASDHTLWLTSDDGVRLWIDGKLVIDNWTSHAATDNSYTMWMNANQLYSVKLEYFENTGGAVAQLSWSTPNYARHYIEPTQLFPAQAANDASESAPSASPGGAGRCGLGTGLGLLVAAFTLMARRRDERA